MPLITRKYPGKNAQDIYEKVDQVMQRLTVKMGLKYDKHPKERAGKVSKMGITGKYLAKDGEATVDLHFPILLPGKLKKQVQDDIERRVDGLFARQAVSLRRGDSSGLRHQSRCTTTAPARSFIRSTAAYSAARGESPVPLADFGPSVCLRFQPGPATMRALARPEMTSGQM